MKQIFAAFLLVCLLAVATEPIHAQSRPRRVGGNTQQQPPPQQQSGRAQQNAPDTSVPRPPQQSGAARPPVLKRSDSAVSNSSVAASANNSSQTQQSSEVDEGDVIRVNTTLVTVPVSVMDRGGRYIPDLRKEDFRIYENGIEQKVAYFATVEKPFTVVLVIDTSRSTHFRLEDIQDAAVSFIDQLRPDDQVMIVSFDDKINVLAEPTNNRGELHQAIHRTRTGGGTRLYDTIDMLINERLRRIEGRKAIVLFTDGVDTTSHRATYQSTVHDAEEADALIFPVEYDTYEEQRDNTNGGGTQPQQWPFPQRRRNRGGIVLGFPFPFPIPGGGNFPGGGGNNGGGGAGSSREEYRRGAAYLNELAEKTGAHLYQADTLQNLAQAFSLIAEELRRQYSLGFYPQTAAQAGERRQIKVRVDRPNVAVRARDSYVVKSQSKFAGALADEQQPSTPVQHKRPFTESP